MAEWTDNERTYGYRVLEAILVSSETETEKQIPTKNELILSELVYAIIERIGGTPKKMPPANEYPDTNYVPMMSAYLDEELTQHTGGLHPKIRNILRNMIKPKVINSDEPLWDQPFCELYRLCTGKYPNEIGIVRYGEKSFAFNQQTIKYINNEFLPKISEQERDNIIDLGKRMRKYIAEDLEKP